MTQHQTNYAFGRRWRNAPHQIERRKNSAGARLAGFAMGYATTTACLPVKSGGPELDASLQLDLEPTEFIASPTSHGQASAPPDGPLHTMDRLGAPQCDGGGDATRDVTEGVAHADLAVVGDDVQLRCALDNYHLISRHRSAPANPWTDATLREIIGQSRSVVMLGQLCILAEDEGLGWAESFSALMKLAAAGVIDLDVTEPIGPSTIVRLG